MTSPSAPLTVAEHAGLSLLARAELVGRESAGPAAAEVDREGRFPHEAVDALRAHKLLNCAVPVDQGGEGASLGELCAVARILGRYCASTAMIFAMHQTQILSLVHHSTPGVAVFVAEAVANDYLIASATTELGTGGDVRSSVCAVARDGDTVTLTKNAPVISYGEYADAILVTAGAPAVVDALTDQLAPGGRLIAPVGGATSQVLLQIDRAADGRLEQRELAPVVFVPLRSGLVD